jgi:hypothetical protein
MIKGIFQALIEVYWTEFASRRFDETHKASVERNKTRILNNPFIKSLVKKESKFTEIPDDVMKLFNDIQKNNITSYSYSLFKSLNKLLIVTSLPMSV